MGGKAEILIRALNLIGTTSAYILRMRFGKPKITNPPTVKEVCNV